MKYIMQSDRDIYKIISYYKKITSNMSFGFTEGKRFSVKNLMSMLGLIFLCISCAAATVVESPQNKVLTGHDKSERERMTEANDMACSYFYFLWGKTAENSHNFEEALEAYEKALLCDEESEYLKRKLAILLIKMGRKEQAARALEQIVSTNPQDTENRILLAKVYASQGRDDEAVAIYQELLEIKEDHDTLLMLGTFYAQNKEYNKAQKILNRLIRLEGDSYLAHYYLARLYRELLLYDKAAASYETALDLNWFDRSAYEVAEFYEGRQDYDKAIAVYLRILEEGESSDVAKTRLVNLYLTLEENDKALELLRELRSILPESHNVDLTMSRILLDQGKYAEAIMILEDILQTNPEVTVVRYLLGMAYYKKDNAPKAEEQLEFIPVESNLYEDSVFLRVKMLSEDDNYQGAIELLEKQVASAASRKASFYILLASLYREQEEIELGREKYEQALRLYPADVDLLYNYGIFLEKIGEQDDAMSKMLEVLVLDPDNGAALNYVGYTWADNGVHLDKALEYIKKAVKLLPDDGYVRDSLGWVYFKMGEINQALVELENASEMVGNDPVIKEHLGDVYLEVGQLEKARAAFEKAYELYEDEEKKENVRTKMNLLESGSAR